MRLLDLIEQNHRIRPPAHRFRQLPAFVVAHIARRRANHARHGMFLHVLAHIEPHHGLLVVEQELRQRPSCLRFAHARRTQENKRPNRPLRIAQSRARTPDRIRHRRQRGILPDHALPEAFLHLHQLAHFAFEHPRHGNPRPLAHDARNVFLVDLFLQHARGSRFPILSRIELLHLRFQFGQFAVLDLRRTLQVPAPRLFLGLEAQRLDLLFHITQPRDRLALLLPARPQSRCLFLDLRELAFHLRQPLLRVRIALALQRRPFDLQ